MSLQSQYGQHVLQVPHLERGGGEGEGWEEEGWERVWVYTHTCTVVSEEAENMYTPTGDSDTLTTVTMPMCPLRVQLWLSVALS